jgi:hypothetical protein
MGTKRVTATSDHPGVHRAEADERRILFEPSLVAVGLLILFDQFVQTAGRSRAPAGSSPAVT